MVSEKYFEGSSFVIDADTLHEFYRTEQTVGESKGRRVGDKNRSNDSVNQVRRKMKNVKR